VLTLVARGYTNREIAATLVISVKTASVHVSHILRTLGAPNRLETAAITHRLARHTPGNQTVGSDRSKRAKPQRRALSPRSQSSRPRTEIRS
jgi:Bacterial regulatory proteins, luxR family